jgi:hypothetical protein
MEEVAMIFRIDGQTTEPVEPVRVVRLVHSQDLGERGVLLQVQEPGTGRWYNVVRVSRSGLYCPSGVPDTLGIKTFGQRVLLGGRASE